MPPSVPIGLGLLDHYTLIVPDAASSARFHAEVLGFKPLRVIQVNAGSAPEGEYDMLNHVLELPSQPGRVLVITEGLTEDSIFRQYLQRYGQGVHHVAYEVDDLDDSLRRLQGLGVTTTSETILRDPITGLRQIFIRQEHGGYFLELIERTRQSAQGEFTHDNMAALAKTMVSYLSAPTGPATSPEQLVRAPLDAVRDFLANPLNLPLWTVHRGVRRIDGVVVEVRMHHDLPLTVTASGPWVHFVWRLGETVLEVAFELLTGDDAGSTLVRCALPDHLEPPRRSATAALIRAELRVLAALLEGRAPSPDDLASIETSHLAVHQRRSL